MTDVEHSLTNLLLINKTKRTKLVHFTMWTNSTQRHCNLILPLIIKVFDTIKSYQDTFLTPSCGGMGVRHVQCGTKWCQNNICIHYWYESPISTWISIWMKYLCWVWRIVQSEIQKRSKTIWAAKSEAFIIIKHRLRLVSWVLFCVK